MKSVRNKRKVLIGQVISDKMDKTIVVKYDIIKRHPLYDKNIVKTNKFKVHNPENKAKLGDIVEIMECRPISKTKKWRLVRIISSQFREYAKATEEAKIIDEKIKEEITVKPVEQKEPEDMKNEEVEIIQEINEEKKESEEKAENIEETKEVKRRGRRKKKEEEAEEEKKE